VDFTQYELDWLRINYNLSTTVRKLKNKIKFVEKVKYKREVIYLDENKKRIKNEKTINFTN
jgi:pheromone shutdown protein TraB